MTLALNALRVSIHEAAGNSRRLMANLEAIEEISALQVKEMQRVHFHAARLRLGLATINSPGTMDHDVPNLHPLSTFEWRHEHSDMQIAETWFHLLHLLRLDRLGMGRAMDVVHKIWGVHPDDLASANKHLVIQFPRVVLIRCMYELGFTQSAIALALQKDKRTMTNSLWRTADILEGITDAAHFDDVRFAPNGPSARRLSPQPDRPTTFPNQKRTRGCAANLGRFDGRKGSAPKPTGEPHRGSPVSVQQGGAGHYTDGQS